MIDRGSHILIYVFAINVRHPSIDACDLNNLAMKNYNGVHEFRRVLRLTSSGVSWYPFAILI